MTLVHTSVIRAVLMLSNAICTHLNSQPPNPPPSEEDQRKVKNGADSQKEFITRNASWGRMAHQTVCNSLAILEAYFIFSSQSFLGAPFKSSISFGPAGLLSTCSSSGFKHIGVSPPLLISTIVVVVGTMIRFVCFAKLGRFFTIELSVMKDHKLIKDGPYSWVRHPAYSGALMSLVGNLIALYAEGSWRRECGASIYNLYGVLSLIWTMQNILMFLFLVKRCGVEDEGMKAEFKDEWVVWSKRTPYKMIPYIF